MGASDESWSVPTVRLLCASSEFERRLGARAHSCGERCAAFSSSVRRPRREPYQPDGRGIEEKALDIALEKKDPKKKLERRQRRQKSSKSNTKSRPDEISGKSEPAKSRYVASEISERVFARANYPCQFCGSGGTRCRTRTGLEIEHVRPFAMFPSHDERYLRVFMRRTIVGPRNASMAPSSSNGRSPKGVAGARLVRGELDGGAYSSS